MHHLWKMHRHYTTHFTNSLWFVSWDLCFDYDTNDQIRSRPVGWAVMTCDKPWLDLIIILGKETWNCDYDIIDSSSSSSNFIPNRKQSTAYVSKDTSVIQYTLMFCWWSPEKPKAYLAGNQKSGRDRLSVDAADQFHGFMNPREWPAQPSSGDRLHQRARQPPAVRTDPLEHNSLQVRTHDRQPQAQALHQPRHTRHSLHAGSGAGCVMYTLEGTKQSRSKPLTLMRKSQCTS